MARGRGHNLRAEEKKKERKKEKSQRPVSRNIPPPLLTLIIKGGLTKHLTNHTSALSNVLVDDGTRDHLEEVGVHVAGNGAGQQGLPRARGTVEQDTLGWLDAHAHKEVRVHERELDNLPDFPNLLVEPTHCRVRHISGILNGHVEHQGVHLPRKLAKQQGRFRQRGGQSEGFTKWGEKTNHSHDGEGGHVKGDTGALDELCLVELDTAPDDVPGSAGGLDND